MNSQNEQNGRPITSRDPRLRNMSKLEPQIDVCRDYVWGICTKYGQCKFRHECTIEEMKSIIHFCHNYQNRTGCRLPNCTYLHTSEEEENLFRTTGQLPRVLLERHTTMNAAAAVAVNKNLQGMEGATLPMFMTHRLPPPPPLVTLPPPLPVPSMMPPPPPPPPPPLPDEPSAVAPKAATIYTAPPPSLATPVVPLINQLPPPLPLFDASKPPPNLVNCAVKRTINDNNCEVGTSKLRKTDEPQVADSLCEKCVHRELSNDLCLEDLDKLNRQKEYKKFLYKSKSEETENMKAMMKFLLPTEICLAVEEYIDGVKTQSLGMSVSMQLMMHRLLEDSLTNSSNMMEPIQSSSMRDLLIGYLCNSNSTTERLASPEPRPNPILGAEKSRSNTSNLPNTSNKLSRVLNGHSVAQQHQIHRTSPNTSNEKSRVLNGHSVAQQHQKHRTSNLPNTSNELSRVLNGHSVAQQHQIHRTSNSPNTSNELSRVLNVHSVAQPQPEPPVTLHNCASQAFANSGASVASGFSTPTSPAYRAYHPGVPSPVPAAAAYPPYQSAVPSPVYPPYQPTVPPPHVRAAYAPPYGSTGAGSPTQAAFPTAASRAPAAPQTEPAPAPAPTPALAPTPAPPPTKSYPCGQFMPPPYQ